jgi:Na+/H+ antiporter NhaA
MAKPTTAPDDGLPSPPVERLLAPVRRFLHIESASGVVLLACTVAALVLANSPLAGGFAAVWKTEVGLTVGRFSLAGDLGHLVVTDGLMTLFFFVIGLEVKREIVAGELRDPRKALLPVLGAAGGALLPAAIFLALQWGQPGQRGWAVPMATDIAFVIGFLTLFGRRVPFGLKIFLLTLAIVDDLVAVLIIAFVYSGAIEWGWLAVAGGGFAVTYGLNRIGVRSIPVYVAVGVAIWLAVYESGIHPTVAGVLLGLLTPASAWVGQQTFVEVFTDKWNRLRGYDPASDELPFDVERLEFAARESVSPCTGWRSGCTRGSGSSSCRCSPWPTPGCRSTRPGCPTRWPSPSPPGWLSASRSASCCSAGWPSASACRPCPKGANGRGSSAGRAWPASGSPWPCSSTGWPSPPPTSRPRRRPGRSAPCSARWSVPAWERVSSSGR